MPRHLLPQVVTANTIGRSSLKVMSSPCNASSHCSWNHSDPENAPQPHEHEASDVHGNIQGIPWVKQYAIPSSDKDHPPMYVCPGFLVKMDEMVIVRVPCSKLIRQQRNDLPDLTTHAAWWRSPINDSKIHLLHHFLPFHASSSSEF